MKKTVSLCVMLGCVLLFSMLNGAEPAWQKLDDRDNIQYFDATVPGSEYRQYKGTAIIDAGMETIFALLRDVSAYKEWILDCKECKLIKDLGGNDQNICYYVYDSQFPVTDRDTVVKTYSVNDLQNGKFALNIDSIEYPEFKLNDKLVHMQLHTKFYGMILGRNQCKISMEFSFSPGGSIAPALIHGFVKALPYKSLLKMREMVAMDKYIELGKKQKDLPAIEAYNKKVGN
jgi:hypothetical protein